MPFRAILFDLYETLFDRTGSLRRFLAHQFANENTGVFPDVDAVATRFLALDERGLQPKQLVYRQLIAEMGAPDPARAERLFQAYEAHAWRFARGFRGMEALLIWLRHCGLATGIVTNGQTHIQLRSLLVLNLDRLTDIHDITESVGLRKPGPSIFAQAAGRLGRVLTECVFVGEPAPYDTVGAKATGMKTIWTPNGAHWPEDLSDRADAEAKDLAEVQATLTRWGVGPGLDAVGTGT